MTAKQTTAKQTTEKQKMRLQMLLLQEEMGSSLPSLGNGGLQEIHRLTASEDGRSRLDDSGRNSASSRGTLTVTVFTDGAAGACAGAPVTTGADLALLTAADVGSRVKASGTAGGLSIGADGTT
jgi:hypothetical protein